MLGQGERKDRRGWIDAMLVLKRFEDFCHRPQKSKNPNPSKMTSLATDGEVKADTTPAATAATIPDNWLDEMAKHCETLLPASGQLGEDIDTVKFFACMKERAGRVYDLLFGGMSGSKLKSDVNNNIKQLEDYFTANPTATSLKGMLELEINKTTLAKCRKASSGPVLSLLWFYRAQNFLVTLIEKFLVDEKTPSQYSSETYTQTLKPYHGWLASKAAGFMMGSCPARATITEKFGFKNWEETKGGAARYVAQMRPVCDTMKAVIDALGCDFPDKV